MLFHGASVHIVQRHARPCSVRRCPCCVASALVTFRTPGAHSKYTIVTYSRFCMVAGECYSYEELAAIHGHVPKCELAMLVQAGLRAQGYERKVTHNLLHESCTVLIGL